MGSCEHRTVEYQQGQSSCAHAGVFPLALLLYVPQETKRPMLASGPNGDDRQEEEKCAALVTLVKPILV